MKVTIKFKFSDDVLFEGEYASTRDAVVGAVSKKTNLIDANLIGADLMGADLRYANLIGADLRYANLRHTNLRYAELIGADLMGADLRHANLRHTNLMGADLRYANLWGEKLTTTPIELQGYHYPILIAGTYMKIGCELHKIYDWGKFKQSRIKLMGKGAQQWWKEYKPLIMPIALHHQEKHNQEVENESNN